MKLRFILCVSVALNLALVAGLASRRQPGPASPRIQTAVPPAVVGNISVETSSAQNDSQPARAEFHWNQVMSADLKRYRDNLLGIGCPRPTVRDIIMGEIDESFGQRRQSLLTDVQNRFWDCVLRGGEPAVREESVKPFLALKAERQKMISDLLGGGFDLPDAGGQTERADFQQRFSWLPPEKQARLFAAEGKQLQELRELAKTTDVVVDGEMTFEENRRLQMARKESNARSDVLTPEEQEESRLRQSNESLWAADMSGFEASEQEWKSVTRLRMEAEDARKGILYSDLNDEDRRNESEKADASLTEALKKTLGADRYAEYARASDDQFQGIYKVTERYGLAENVAVQAYEVQQAAAAQAGKIRNDASLAPDLRQRSLETLQRDTEQALAKALGEKVLSTYKEYGGDWIGKLGEAGGN
jgi:hypothetical protein